MEYFMIEKDDRTFKVYLWPDGFCSYEFKIYEIVPKKHWWSLGRTYLTGGTAYNHIKDEVLEKLDKCLQRERRIQNLSEEFDMIKNTSVEIYTKTEQKRLLCDIAHWHVTEFYNRMVDHWTDINDVIDTECTETIKKLEKVYAVAYGPLPQWDTIYDVTKSLDELQVELKTVSMDEMHDCLDWSIITYGGVKTIKATDAFVEYLKHKYNRGRINPCPDCINQFMGVDIVVNNSISNPFYELVF